MNGPTAFALEKNPDVRSLRLLLAEHNPTTQLFLNDLLRTDYEVSVCSDGEQAWREAQRIAPDLVLSDLRMPNLDGIGLTRRLRENARTAAVPIILLTADNKLETLLAGLEAGADDFLLKPFRPLEVLARLHSIHRLVESRRQATELFARKAAEAADLAKHRFLAVLSHELRTPLTPIQFGLHAMSQQKGLSAVMRENVEMIRRNVEAEIKLIGDLLDVSRIVHGKLELNLGRTDLHGCIEQVLGANQDNFASKNHQITVALDACRELVPSDAVRLRQVFGELIGNAAKFTPKDGKISVRSSDLGGGIVVEITDSGFGVEAAYLPMIFQAFEQGDPDVMARYGGLGLGLAIARAIVTAHGGELTAVSTGRNQGVTFVVRLPGIEDAIIATQPALVSE